MKPFGRTRSIHASKTMSKCRITHLPFKESPFLFAKTQSPLSKRHFRTGLHRGSLVYGVVCKYSVQHVEAHLGATLPAHREAHASRVLVSEPRSLMGTERTPASYPQLRDALVNFYRAFLMSDRCSLLHLGALSLLSRPLAITSTNFVWI